jgi:hypothetical protein
MEQTTSRLARHLGALATITILAMSAGVPAASAETPSIKKISPSSGPGAGGTEVTISGKMLSTESCMFFPAGNGCPNLIVYFGIEPGLVVHATKKEIQVFSAEQFSEVGTVNVTVVNPTGTSNSARFTYTAPPTEAMAGEVPVVSAVEPNYGAQAGFNEVRIRGEHLTPNNNGCVQCDGDVVHFGTTNVSVAQGSGTELLVHAPPHAAGMVDVTVTTNPGGTSAAGAADQYTYE